MLATVDGRRVRDEGEPYVARTCAQIAEEMQRRHGIRMTPGTVSQTLLRGLKKLRTALEETVESEK